MPSTIPLIAKIFYRDPTKEAPDGLFVVRSEPDYVRLSLEDRERFRRSIDGAGWDRVLNRWSIRKDQLLATVQRLEAAQIHVSPHAMVLPYLVREDSEAVERVTEAQGSIEELEIKLAKKGYHLFDFQRADILFMASRNRVINANEQGLGKAQPDSEPVLTPIGFRPMGSLRVGDKVIGSYGQTTTVTGVFPQGIDCRTGVRYKVPIYKLILEDGRTARSTIDHLWKVKTPHFHSISTLSDVDAMRRSGADLSVPVLNLFGGGWVKIANTEACGSEMATCISVDAPDRLYVTNDFIVTHNTIESLCALSYGAAVLVGCPKEAKSVWERECHEWRDDFVPIVIEKKSQFRMPAAHELIICNYDILPKCSPEPFPAPLTTIFDEIHKLKSAGAIRTAAAKSYAVRASRIFALTGTPLPNNPNELWAILEVFGLAREVFGTKDRMIEFFYGKQTYYYTSSACDKCRGDGFHNNPDPNGEPLKCSYCRGGMRSIPKASGMRWSVCPTNIHRFTDERGRVRRSPDWTPAPLGCEVAFAKQADTTAATDPAITPTSVPTPYDHTKPADNASCPVCHGQPMPPDPQIAELLKRVMIRHEKIDVLKDLPPKIYKVMSVPLDKKILKEVDASIEAEVRTALLEAEDLDEVKELHAGLMRGRRVLAEAKIAYAQQLLDEWEADNVVSLVFSAHRAPIEQISMRAGWGAIIGGSTLDRGQVQRDFQAGKYRGLAGTIGAASTALTLTLATRELFIDRAWVPADNDQAEDRAHRIGQTAGLIIVDLVAEHPIDRHVHILNHRKRGIIRASIGRVRGNRDVNLPLLRAIERAGKK